MNMSYELCVMSQNSCQEAGADFTSCERPSLRRRAPPFRQTSELIPPSRVFISAAVTSLTSRASVILPRVSFVPSESRLAKGSARKEAQLSKRSPGSPYLPVPVPVPALCASNLAATHTHSVTAELGLPWLRVTSARARHSGCNHLFAVCVRRCRGGERRRPRRRERS